jgi:uncharacterized protein YqhQ
MAERQERVRLGGMAMQNGILVHSFDHWAAAVRDASGSVRVASGRKPELPPSLLAVPGVRGLARMGEMMFLLPIVKRDLPDARLPMESGQAAAAIAGSVVISRLIRRSRLKPLAAELLGAGVSLAPALAALRSSQLARYHGAEHKAIGAYEHGEEAVDATKEHDRCGSHMVGPLIAATVAGNVLVSKLPATRRSNAARLVVSLGAVAFATETFGWMTRHRNTALARALARPGFELQRVAATKEPSEQELEVAEVALNEVLRLEAEAA